MTAQNLVSGALSPEKSSGVTKSLSDVGTNLDMLVILQPEEKKELARVGKTFGPFIELAHGVTTDHPQIMPGVFDIAEFDRDYQLARRLEPILHQLEELSEAVQDTIFAANSDAMLEALQVYAAVQQNKDKIPGMDTIAAKMADFFKRRKRQPAETVETASKT